MERLIITVMTPGAGHGHDLEVPAGLPTAELADRIARAMQWPSTHQDGAPVTYQMEVLPPGLLLHPDQTLADAGVLDGACIVLHPRRTAAPIRPAPAPKPATAKAGPVVGWRQL